MRCPDRQIQEAVLHPDRAVRDAAIRYFSRRTVAERFGRSATC